MYTYLHIYNGNCEKTFLPCITFFQLMVNILDQIVSLCYNLSALSTAQKMWSFYTKKRLSHMLTA